MAADHTILRRMAEKNDSKRGGAGPQAIAATLGRLTRPVLARRGFAEAGVVAEWPSIVGSALASQTCPLKIVFARGERGDGTLHLRVASGAMATQLQHLEPLIIERINVYFGYRAVGRLALSQGPLPRRRKPKPQAIPAEAAEVERRLGAVDDAELKAALAGLGRWVLRRP